MTILDAEDRELVGKAAIIGVSLTVTVLGTAGVLGLAWRLFGMAAG